MAYPGSRAHTFVADEEVLSATLNAWGPNNVAWGLVAAPASSVTGQTGISTLADITFATLTWTSVLGRWYEVTVSVRLLQVTSTGLQELVIDTAASGAGTRLARTAGLSVVAGSAGLGTLTGFVLGDGNSMSAHARCSTSAGTVTVDNSVQTGRFVVKDIGLNAP